MKDPHYEFDGLDELERDCEEVRVWAIIWLMMILGGIGWAMGDNTFAIIMICGAVAFLHWTKEIIR